EAELAEPYVWEQGDYLTRRIQALLSMNSRRLVTYLLAYLQENRKPQSDEEQLMLNMLYYTFYRSEPAKQGFHHIEHALQTIFSFAAFRAEAIEVLQYNLAQIDFVDKPNEFPYACPLDLHCNYSM